MLGREITGNGRAAPAEDRRRGAASSRSAAQKSPCEDVFVVLTSNSGPGTAFLAAPETLVPRAGGGGSAPRRAQLCPGGSGRAAGAAASPAPRCSRSAGTRHGAAGTGLGPCGARSAELPCRAARLGGAAPGAGPFSLPDRSLSPVTGASASVQGSDPDEVQPGAAAGPPAFPAAREPPPRGSSVRAGGAEGQRRPPRPGRAAVAEPRPSPFGPALPGPARPRGGRCGAGAGGGRGGGGGPGSSPGVLQGKATLPGAAPPARLIPGALHRWHRPPENRGCGRRAASGAPAAPGGQGRPHRSEEHGAGGPDRRSAAGCCPVCARCVSAGDPGAVPGPAAPGPCGGLLSATPRGRAAVPDPRSTTPPPVGGRLPRRHFAWEPLHACPRSLHSPARGGGVPRAQPPLRLSTVNVVEGWGGPSPAFSRGAPAGQRSRPGSAVLRGAGAPPPDPGPGAPKSRPRRSAGSHQARCRSWGWGGRGGGALSQLAGPRALCTKDLLFGGF